MAARYNPWEGIQEGVISSAGGGGSTPPASTSTVSGGTAIGGGTASMPSPQAGALPANFTPPASTTGQVVNPDRTYTNNVVGNTSPPGAPAAPGGGNETAGGDDAWNEMNKVFQDILGQHQASWADTEKSIMANQAMNQRRAAEINASMGRSIGGGMAGLMAQAQLGGQQQLLQGRAAHEDRGRQLQLAWLDTLERREERQADREHNIALAEMQFKPPPLPDPNTPPPPPGGTTAATNQSNAIMSTSGKLEGTKTEGAKDYAQATGNDLLNEYARVWHWPSMTTRQKDLAQSYMVDYFNRTQGKWPTADSVLGYLRQYNAGYLGAE